jgi:hypothetical protein
MYTFSTYTKYIQNKSALSQRHWRWLGHSRTDQISLLKRGIWIYFLLWIFEGTLRRWFLPGLATPLLIVRDPVALWLLWKCWEQRLLPINAYIFLFQIIGIIAIYTAVFWGHGNLGVALFGARIFLIHFPFIFIMGQIFDRSDVVKIGIVLLIISIPMTALIAMQYFSPQSAWVNRGVGGDIAGAGFNGAMGYYRPPATFSFTTGTTYFYDFASCFIFYFWFHKKEINKLLLVVATICLVAAIPLSLSRGVTIQIGLTFLFSIIAVCRKPQYAGRMIMAVIGALLIIAIFSKTSFFQISTATLTNRFEKAGEAEGGLQGTLGNRFIGGLIATFKQALNLPFLGYGLGMGTNVGGFILSGDRTFLISESEWGRVVGELGPVMGFTVIFLRLSLGIEIAVKCYKKLRQGDFLPWTLLSLGLLTLTQGSWSQPSALGFSVLISGLMLASLKTPTTLNQKMSSI